MSLKQAIETFRDSKKESTDYLLLIMAVQKFSLNMPTVDIQNIIADVIEDGKEGWCYGRIATTVLSIGDINIPFPTNRSAKLAAHAPRLLECLRDEARYIKSMGSEPSEATQELLEDLEGISV